MFERFEIMVDGDPSIPAGTKFTGKRLEYYVKLVTGSAAMAIRA